MLTPNNYLPKFGSTFRINFSFQKPNAILNKSFLTAAVFGASLSSLAYEAGEDRS